jgi:thiosulfate/3-mercaptopyruvate sulfurtransferase
MQYAHPEVLVDTQWLADHLDDPMVRIVEVDMVSQLGATHIPGAVFWQIFGDLVEPNLRQKLDPAGFAALMGRSGITNEMTVVAYGSYPGTGAWIFWLLKLFGHEEVRVLNGGLQKWQAEERPLTAELASFAAVEYEAKALDAGLRVLSQEVRAAIDDPMVVLLDVRTVAEFRGEVYLDQLPQAGQRAGHIPGAVHLGHDLTLNDDGTFKSADELQELLAGRGVRPELKVIPYCAIGGRSAYVWFVLKYLLGYEQVRNYDGSWNEWSRIPDAPWTS